MVVRTRHVLTTLSRPTPRKPAIPSAIATSIAVAVSVMGNAVAQASALLGDALAAANATSLAHTVAVASSEALGG